MFGNFLKNIGIITLGALVSFSSLFICTASTETEYKISEISGKYKTQGRTAVIDGALMLDWTASGMIFNANCSGDVKITVDTKRINSGATQGIYFTVIVDGVTQCENLRIPNNNSADVWTSNSTEYPFHITKSGESTFTIASDLASGNHTFEIYKQTEAQYTSFGIKSITINGQISAPPADSDLYIEVIGDSVASGLGNISTGGKDAPLYQDATRGWPFLTAKKLNADLSVIAQTGITATKNIGWSGKNSLTMPDIYSISRYFSDETTPHNFERQPDVILVALGTNDIWTYKNCGATTETVQQGYIDLLTLLRNKNPKAKIVWLHGMMTGDDYTQVSWAILEMGGNSKGFYSLSLPRDRTGGQGHPGLSAQSTYANTIVSLVKNIFSESDDTQLNDTPSNSTSSNNPPNKNSSISDSISSTPAISTSGSSSNVNTSSAPSTGSSSTENNTDNNSLPTSNGNKSSFADNATEEKSYLPIVFGAIGGMVAAACIGVAIILLVGKKNRKNSDE